MHAACHTTARHVSPSAFAQCQSNHSRLIACSAIMKPWYPKRSANSECLCGVSCVTTDDHCQSAVHRTVSVFQNLRPLRTDQTLAFVFVLRIRIVHKFCTLHTGKCCLASYQPMPLLFVWCTKPIASMPLDWQFRFWPNAVIIISHATYVLLRFSVLLEMWRRRQNARWSTGLRWLLRCWGWHN